MCQRVKSDDLGLFEHLIPLVGLDQGADQCSVGILGLACAVYDELLAVLALGDANG